MKQLHKTRKLINKPTLMNTSVRKLNGLCIPKPFVKIFKLKQRNDHRYNRCMSLPPLHFRAAVQDFGIARTQGLFLVNNLPKVTEIYPSKFR